MFLRKIIMAVMILACFQSSAQLRFSVSTDINVLHNFSPHQQFTAVGQSFSTDLHFRPRESGVIRLRYCIPGKFQNSYVAAARSSGTANFPYRVASSWRFREVMLGWKHYFVGSYDADAGWQVYGLAGFGVAFIQADNTFLPDVDTSLYVPRPMPVKGVGNFKRLTADLGLGAEYALTGNFFVYSDLQTWLHMSSYPSPYLHSNKNVPFPLSVSLGIRVLFGE